MARRKRQPVISLSEIESHKAKGWNQSEIAREYGVTRQYISWIVHEYGGRLSPRSLVLEEHFPWTVPGHMQSASVCRRLRDHAEFVTTWGMGMSQDSRDRLRSLYRRLREDDVVVEFDPSIPSTPGLALDGGFALRPRTKADGKLLIRVNEHTRLTREGRTLWELPPIDP